MIEESLSYRQFKNLYVNIYEIWCCHVFIIGLFSGLALRLESWTYPKFFFFFNVYPTALLHQKSKPTPTSIIEKQRVFSSSLKRQPLTQRNWERKGSNGAEVVWTAYVYKYSTRGSLPQREGTRIPARPSRYTHRRTQAVSLHLPQRIYIYKHYQNYLYFSLSQSYSYRFFLSELIHFISAAFWSTPCISRWRSNPLRYSTSFYYFSSIIIY